jgi:hypothetical protein
MLIIEADQVDQPVDAHHLRTRMKWTALSWTIMAIPSLIMS